MTDGTPPAKALADPRAWKAEWVADLDRVAARDRWGRALLCIGVIHFVAFAVCEYLHTSGILQESPYVAIWLLELAAVLMTMQFFAGRYWWRATPLAGILGRVWGTFLLLSFNLTTMNSLTGIEASDSFKPALTNQATFAFAITAYLLSPRYFIPAVQMYFTGLLMIALPKHSYAIHGISWLTILVALSVILERRRRRLFPEFTGKGASLGEGLRNRLKGISAEDFAQSN